MALPDYVTDYQERNWQTYVIPFGDEPQLSGEPAELSVCNSDSPRAYELKDAPSRFYVDCELASADLDPGAGAQVGCLVDEWRGHAAGSLVICSYEQVRAGNLVYAVEI